MKAINFDGCYGAHWTLSEPYDDLAAMIRESVENGEDFTVDYGAKKEIVSVTITRENGILDFTVYSSIDELPNITDTVLWQALGGNDYAGSGYHAIALYHGLHPDKDDWRIVEILDECASWFDGIYQETFEVSESLGDGRDYDVLMSSIGIAESEAMRQGEDCCQAMIEYAKESIALIS